jgi:hypothetical protein
VGRSLAETAACSTYTPTVAVVFGNGLRVEVSSGVDAELLRTVVQALQSC